MKKFFGIATSLLITAAVLSQFVSCEKYLLPALSLSPDTLTFEAQGGVGIAEVLANVHWDVETGDFPEWLSCDPDEGKGDGYVEFLAEPDSTGTRMADISIKSQTIKKQLTIVQKGPEQTGR